MEPSDFTARQVALRVRLDQVPARVALSRVRVAALVEDAHCGDDRLVRSSSRNQQNIVGIRACRNQPPRGRHVAQSTGIHPRSYRVPPQGAQNDGVYVNSLAADEGQRGVRRAYPADKLARLTALKTIWDPHNVFHLNHNIRPHSR